jgi:hypothetical protein
MCWRWTPGMCFAHQTFRKSRPRLTCLLSLENAAAAAARNLTRALPLDESAAIVL